MPSVSGGHGSPGRTQTSRLAGAGVYGLPEWVRPLLENCIVDASIFEFFQDCSVMIAGEGSLLCGGRPGHVVLVSVIVVLLKFLRAHWWMPWH